MGKQASNSDKKQTSTDLPELRTTVDFSVDYKDEIYQFIYGSQLFGTSFAVYANFRQFKIPSKAQTKSKRSTNNFEIKGIDFKLINYKGCVNLGFTKEPVDYWDGGNENPHNFTFYVEALGTVTDKTQNFQDRRITISSCSEMRFHRMLMPHKGVSVVTTPGEKATSQGLPFFDTEFNYRDGYFEAPNYRGEGLYVPPPANTRVMASRRCHQSRVFICC